MMTRTLKYVPAVAVMALLGTCASQGALDTDLATLLTDCDSTWTTVKGIALGIFTFGVILYVVKKIKAR